MNEGYIVNQFETKTKRFCQILELVNDPQLIENINSGMHLKIGSLNFLKGFVK